MTIEEIIQKYTTALSAESELSSKLERRRSLYYGDGKIYNKNTHKSVQAECHQNITFELIESQISNAIPAPSVTPCLVEDSQRALAITNYLQEEMVRLDGISINDRAERGTLKNGYHFYVLEWDASAKNNSGYGALNLREYPAGSVFVQPGISNFNDAEYVYIRSVTTINKLSRLYKIPKEELIPTDPAGDTIIIITCYYLNDDGDLGRAIFLEGSNKVISQDDYYELRRVTCCKKCGTPILNLDKPCPMCQGTDFEPKILKDEIATDDIWIGDMELNAQLRAAAKIKGEPDDPHAGLEKIVTIGDKIPWYHIRELPVVMRVSVSDENSIYGISDIDRIEQNQDTINRITTKDEENILKAGSFVTYPKGINIPNDDSTLKMVPISDPRLKDAFSVQTIQANMQQDDIYASRMNQWARANLGITESYQGKRDTTATSGKAKEMAAAQSAGRLESKQRMKVQAYGEIYRKAFKFLLAYADETQNYIQHSPDGDLLQLTFNRYMFLKKNDDGAGVYWDDNFIISADNASLISNKPEMWQTITQQFMSGALGNVADPAVMKLYWEIMKQLQFPFSAAILQNMYDRQMDLDPAMKTFLLQNPDILQYIAQMMAQNKNAQLTGQTGQTGPSKSTNSSVGAQNSGSKMKTGSTAMTNPQPANPVPPDMRLKENIANAEN